MAALEKNRDTPRLATAPIVELLTLPVKGGVEIFVGALVGLDADGYLVPADSDATLKIAGRAEQHIDASDADDGDLTCDVKQGTFKWGNGSSSITIADVGEFCFADDDQTVEKHGDAGARPPAGVIVGLEDDGVWVETRLSLSAVLRVATGVDELS